MDTFYLNNREQFTPKVHLLNAICKQTDVVQKYEGIFIIVNSAKFIFRMTQMIKQGKSYFILNEQQVQFILFDFIIDNMNKTLFASDMTWFLIFDYMIYVFGLLFDQRYVENAILYVQIVTRYVMYSHAGHFDLGMIPLDSVSLIGYALENLRFQMKAKHTPDTVLPVSINVAAIIQDSIDLISQATKLNASNKMIGFTDDNGNIITRYYSQNCIAILIETNYFWYNYNYNSLYEIMNPFVFHYTWWQMSLALVGLNVWPNVLSFVAKQLYNSLMAFYDCTDRDKKFTDPLFAQFLCDVCMTGRMDKSDCKWGKSYFVKRFHLLHPKFTKLLKLNIKQLEKNSNEFEEYLKAIKHLMQLEFIDGNFKSCMKYANLQQSIMSMLDSIVKGNFSYKMQQIRSGITYPDTLDVWCTNPKKIVRKDILGSQHKRWQLIRGDRVLGLNYMLRQDAHGYNIKLDDIICIEKKTDVVILKNIASLKECNWINCSRKDICLKKCKKCRSVYYCSGVCQKKDWKYHKLLCKRSKKRDYLMTLKQWTTS